MALDKSVTGFLHAFFGKLLRSHRVKPFSSSVSGTSSETTAQMN